MAKNGKFHKLDANKDGMLSKDEVKGNAMLEKNFDAMDTDKDGQLSAQEQKAYMASHKAAKGGKDKSKPVS